MKLTKEDREQMKKVEKVFEVLNEVIDTSDNCLDKEELLSAIRCTNTVVRGLIPIIKKLFCSTWVPPSYQHLQEEDK